MGFNSVVVILNDCLHEIESDPFFGKKVAQAIRAHGGRPEHRPYITGQTQVLSVEHADTMQIVAIGGNTGRVIGYAHYRSTDDEIVKALNSQRRDRAKNADTQKGTK